MEALRENILPVLEDDDIVDDDIETDEDDEIEEEGGLVEETDEEVKTKEAPGEEFGEPEQL
jgi:hypothetical protein